MGVRCLCLRAKRCSWILVSCTLASFELVTMRQFMMPSETVSVITCRNRAWTTAGAAGDGSDCWGAPNMSDRAASRSSFKGTGGFRTTSPLHRWIDRSKFAPAFLRTYVGKVATHRFGCIRPTLIEKSSTVLPPILVRCPTVVGSSEPSRRVIRSRSRATCRSCSSICFLCVSTVSWASFYTIRRRQKGR